MWMHCQARSCGRLFHVARDVLNLACPDCNGGPIRAATELHARLAESCNVSRVTIYVIEKKGRK